MWLATYLVERRDEHHLIAFPSPLVSNSKIKDREDGPSFSRTRPFTVLLNATIISVQSEEKLKEGERERERDQANQNLI